MSPNYMTFWKNQNYGGIKKMRIARDCGGGRDNRKNTDDV